MLKLLVHIVIMLAINVSTLAFIMVTGNLEESLVLTILNYEFYEFMIMIIINLIPVAWVIAEITSVVHGKCKFKEGNMVSVEGENVVVSTNKRKRKKVFSEERFNIKMQVSKLNMLYNVTVFDDELEDEENEYLVQLVSPTKINGEPVHLNLKNEKVYQNLKLGQVLDVELTVSLDKKGNEIDRRFEFVL